MRERDCAVVVCWLAIGLGIEAGLPAHTGLSLAHAATDKRHHHHSHTHTHGPQLERAPPFADYDDQDKRPPAKETEPPAPCPNCVSGHHHPHHHTHTHTHPHPHKHHRRPDKPAAALGPRLEAIKTQILSKLGLAAKPNVTISVSREVVQDTIERAEALEGVEEETPPPTTRLPQELAEPDDFYGRTREIITFAEPGLKVCSLTIGARHMLNGQTLLEFPHPHTSEGEGAVLRVKSATLWVKVQAVPSETFSRAYDRNVTLWIFRVAPSQLRNASYLKGKEFDEHTEMSASLPVALSSLGWQRFELTPTVRQWYDSGTQQRLRLLVDCSGCTSLVEAVLFQGASSARPYLVVHTESVATRRVRRRAIDCQGNNTLCCKERFYVSFRELEWDDWIIAPSGYFANYCRGDCGGMRPDMIANHHAHVIEEYRKMDRLNGMQPCCAPLKFSSMSLIYFGPDANIIKRDLPKMVVDECGCP